MSSVHSNAAPLPVKSEFDDAASEDRRSHQSSAFTIDSSSSSIGAYPANFVVKSDPADADIPEISAATDASTSVSATATTSSNDVDGDDDGDSSSSDPTSPPQQQRHPTSYRCVLCDEVFDQRVTLVRHFLDEEMAEFAPESLECVDCLADPEAPLGGAAASAAANQPVGRKRLRFASMEDKIDHVLQDHALIEPENCQDCGKRFWVDLERHKQSGCGR